jgi:hypothetical protein
MGTRENKMKNDNLSKIREALEFYADPASWDDEVGYKPRLEDRAIGSDRGKRARQSLHLLTELEQSQALVDEGVKIPSSTEEARLMTLLGMKYLEENAPDVLKMPEVVTIADMSRNIQTWSFDDDVEGAFGEYLMKKYPSGIKIVSGEGV